MATSSRNGLRIDDLSRAQDTVPSDATIASLIRRLRQQNEALARLRLALCDDNRMIRDVAECG